MRFSWRDAFERFEFLGWRLLGAYVDAGTPCEARHLACGTRAAVRLSNLWRSHHLGVTGCNRCEGTEKLRPQEAPAAFSALGWSLQEPYLNANQPVLAEHRACATAHRVRLTTLRRARKQGTTGCLTCARSAPLSEHEVRQRLSRRGIRLVDPVFQGSTASHQWECLRCDHRWNATFASLRPERRKCPRCSRRRRRFQVLFFGAIKAFLPEAQYEAKGVLGRLEADIWLPNLRVVIEPGARVWHGYSGREERDRRARLRDRRKEAMCRRLGIRLVRVWYEDFEQQPGIVLTQVAKALGLAPGEFTECFERLRGNPTDEMRDLLHKRLASSREQRKILRLVLAGVRPAEIARQTGLPRWIVYRVLAEERLSVPDRVPPPLQAELARRFTEERCSILRLSEEYGISRAIITKRLRDRGLRPRKGSGLEQPIADQHGTVYPSQAEAARRLGLRQGNISHVLARKRTSVGGYRFSYVLPRPTRSTSPARPPQ